MAPRQLKSVKDKGLTVGLFDHPLYLESLGFTDPAVSSSS